MQFKQLGLMVNSVWWMLCYKVSLKPDNCVAFGICKRILKLISETKNFPQILLRSMSMTSLVIPPQMAPTVKVL